MKQLDLAESYASCPSLFKHKAPLYWLVVNFIRMSIVIIAYLVLIILWAVKSIRHNPIPFCRSKVQSVWWFTVQSKPSYKFNSYTCLPFLRVAVFIKFSEHPENKSNLLNNGIASPVSQWETTGHVTLITRLIMLDTAVSRGYTEWQWSIQMSQWERSYAKYSVQSVQVKGGRRDLAQFSSSHGIIVNFHIQGQTFSVIHTLHSLHSYTSPMGSGYYSVGSVNDSIFPCLIAWSNTRVTKSSIQKQNTEVVIIPLFLPAYPF